MATSVPDTDGELAEDGPLATLFSGPARTRIIEAFVANKSRDLNVSDVARLSDTARSTVYRHIEDLQELGVVEAVGTGGSERYTLSEDSDLSELLWKLEGVALERLLEVEQDE